jgi:hypothetical protein
MDLVDFFPRQWIVQKTSSTVLSLITSSGLKAYSALMCLSLQQRVLFLQPLALSVQKLDCTSAVQVLVHAQHTRALFFLFFRASALSTPVARKALVFGRRTEEKETEQRLMGKKEIKAVRIRHRYRRGRIDRRRDALVSGKSLMRVVGRSCRRHYPSLL